MKKKVLFLTVATVAYGANVSNAAVFSDKAYSKHKLSVGYELQNNANIKSQLDGSFSDFKDIDPYQYTFYATDPKAKSKSYALTVNFGENFYYKITDLIHPFIGFDMQLRLPFRGKSNVSFSEGTKNINNLNSYDKTVDLNFFEHLRVNAKIGTKISLAKHFAVEVYGTAGANLATSKINNVTVSKMPGWQPPKTDVYSFTSSKVSVGYNVGVGAEAIIAERITLGVDYRYSSNNFNFVDTGMSHASWGQWQFKSHSANRQIKNHSVGARIGIQF